MFSFSDILEFSERRILFVFQLKFKISDLLVETYDLFVTAVDLFEKLLNELYFGINCLVCPRHELLPSSLNWSQLCQEVYMLLADFDLIIFKLICWAWFWLTAELRFISIQFFGHHDHVVIIPAHHMLNHFISGSDHLGSQIHHVFEYDFVDKDASNIRSALQDFNPS